jgi:hypothetical protein
MAIDACVPDGKPFAGTYFQKKTGKLHYFVDKQL